MTRTASLCGLTDPGDVQALLFEWMECEEGPQDVDVAYLSGFLLQLVSRSDWHLLEASLSVLISHPSRQDARWSEVVADIISLIQREAPDVSCLSHIFSQNQSSGS